MGGQGSVESPTKKKKKKKKKADSKKQRAHAESKPLTSPERTTPGADIRGCRKEDIKTKKFRLSQFYKEGDFESDIGRLRMSFNSRIM
jgi:hypothetical protein